MARPIGTARRAWGWKSCCRRRGPQWESNLKKTEKLIAHLKRQRYIRVEKPKPMTAYERKGHFNFLGLPRELRDDVYSYALGTNTVGEFGVYDSLKTQAKHHLRPDVRKSPRRRSEGVSSSSAILNVNSQLHSEAMDAVYRKNIFVVTVDSVSPIFEVRESKRGFNKRKAIPFGWDLSKIVKMCVRIDLGPDYDVTIEPPALNWDGLSKMRCLRELRLVVTAWDGGRKYIDEWFGLDGIDGLRKMMSELVPAIPKGVEEVRFGIEDSYDDFGVWGGYVDGDWESYAVSVVPGGILRNLFHDLRKLEGDSGMGKAIQP